VSGAWGDLGTQVLSSHHERNAMKYSQDERFLSRSASARANLTVLRHPFLAISEAFDSSGCQGYDEDGPRARLIA
jgi:hypothetical protein